MKILFICTHNRCRSILSEAIANHAGDGRLQAASAGSQPVGEVHPLSIKYLQEQGIAIDGLKSQSWDELESFAPDVVVTVCDSAAGETCPAWFGKSIKLHWGLEDPSKVEGSDDQIKAAFLTCINEIKFRIHKILELDLDNLTGDALKAELVKLGAQG
ncbi:arsenate reductase ArsC [Oceaniserpentilla sp. 4NH20-0058]|uniref:arsenate reductase ArsC n=1 Tax=Oceaniserpentilla sp. 4NH20-0058 TaxID=3127660 RepID=UPI00310C3FF4